MGFSAVNPLTSRVTDQEVRALSPAAHAKIVGLRDGYEALHADVLERGTRTGAFALTDVRLARLALLEMGNGVANRYRPDGRVDVGTLQDRFGFTSSDVLSTPFPLFHIDAATLTTLAALSVGRPPRSGAVTFDGRSSDSIRRRGENISAFEVEEIAGGHRDVVEAAAVSVPSEYTEEDVKLFVVVREGSMLTAADLHAHCCRIAPRFMVSRYPEHVYELRSVCICTRQDVFSSRRAVSRSNKCSDRIEACSAAPTPS